MVELISSWINRFNTMTQLEPNALISQVGITVLDGRKKEANRTRGAHGLGGGIPRHGLSIIGSA